MHDAEKLLEISEGDFDDTSEYQLLIRLLKEQTITDDDGTRRLREKKEKEDPSKVLMNPESTLVVRFRKALWISDSGQSRKESIILLI